MKLHTVLADGPEFLSTEIVNRFGVRNCSTAAIIKIMVAGEAKFDSYCLNPNNKLQIEVKGHKPDTTKLVFEGMSDWSIVAHDNRKLVDSTIITLVVVSAEFDITNFFECFIGSGDSDVDVSEMVDQTDYDPVTRTFMWTNPVPALNLSGPRQWIRNKNGDKRALMISYWNSTNNKLYISWAMRHNDDKFDLQAGHSIAEQRIQTMVEHDKTCSHVNHFEIWDCTRMPKCVARNYKYFLERCIRYYKLPEGTSRKILQHCPTGRVQQPAGRLELIESPREVVEMPEELVLVRLTGLTFSGDVIRVDEKGRINADNSDGKSTYQHYTLKPGQLGGGK